MTIPEELTDILGERSSSIDFIDELKNIKIEYEENNDFLGCLYMSLISVGKKDTNGIYYTPYNAVNKIISSLNFKDNECIADPACGSGNFLIQAFKSMKNNNIPTETIINNLYGFDIDPIACLLAKINIYILDKNIDYASINIYNQIVLNKKKKKFKVFPIVNGIVFILISLFILLPMWKVIVDSFDARSSYGFKWLPNYFTWGGYRAVVTRQSIYRPFFISCITTVAGTFFGLLLATLGGYVLIQWEMPGRSFFAYMLLFTMIFDGGMIPKYLVMKDLNLLNTLWSVILPMSINVYNLVLMRNFFEGIPESLFED